MSFVLLLLRIGDILLCTFQPPYKNKTAYSNHQPHVSLYVSPYLRIISRHFLPHNSPHLVSRLWGIHEPSEDDDLEGHYQALFTDTTRQYSSSNPFHHTTPDSRLARSHQIMSQRPKLTLFVDIVSPFAYMAFYVTQVCICQSNKKKQKGKPTN